MQKGGTSDFGGNPTDYNDNHRLLGVPEEDRSSMRRSRKYSRRNGARSMVSSSMISSSAEGGGVHNYIPLAD